MRRILLDTDLAMGAPGSDIDDGFALALALADLELSVELVTTVSGNTDVETATRLTLDLLQRLGRSDVPVVRGAAHGLRGWWRGPASSLPVRRQGAAEPQPGQAAVHIVERVAAEPGVLTIVAIGPLTNIALAIAMEPVIAEQVQEIVVMGGVFLGQTNLSVMPGEFNTWADPDATAIVLESGAPLSFVGLDVTEQVRLTRDDAARLAASGRDFGAFAGECTREWIDHKARTNPGDPRSQDSCAMHDPLAVATVTRPDLVTWRPAFVQVETASALTRGVMVADLLTLDEHPEPNCRIAVDVDSQAFVDLFLERIASL